MTTGPVSIGGLMTAHQLARLHAPNEATQFDGAIHELHKQGLTPRDIAAHLRLNISAVHTALIRRPS